MWSVDMLGYIAGIFLLLMASMRSQVYMRLFNVAGNLTFILYGYLAEVWPVLVMNAAMLGMHAYRLSKTRPSKGPTDQVGSPTLNRLTRPIEIPLLRETCRE